MPEDKVYRTELSPVSFLRRNAFVFPDKNAVVHGSRRYSYAQFADRVARLAGALRERGLGRHERVAFLSPNTPALLEAHFAVPAAGGVLVAVNTRLNTEEIEYILQDSGALYLFVDRELYPLVETLDLGVVQCVLIHDSGQPDDPYEMLLAAATPLVDPEPLKDEEEPISMNYTSGTTGRPKGVVYTHRGAYLNALGEVLDDRGQRLPVDLADVSLQRLVLHLGGDGRRRHPRLFAAVGFGEGLGLASACLRDSAYEQRAPKRPPGKAPERVVLSSTANEGNAARRDAAAPEFTRNCASKH